MGERNRHVDLSAPAVSCEDVVKEYGDGETLVHALRGVNLEIPFGQMTLLEGPSGCGKTTLLSIIAGLLTPTSGRVRVLGANLHEISDRRRTEFRRDNLGFVFQVYNLLPALTAAENAAVPLIVRGESRRAAVRAAGELLSRMRMEHRAAALPRELSGGECQRVAVARALVHKPKLVLCDEPTASLDAETGHDIMQLLRDIAVEPGRAVVVVTHDPRVFEFGDRVATIEDGKILSVKEQPEGAPS